jgi:hypothetical protein
MMGFKLPDFNVRADIVPRKARRLRLVPEKTETFIFPCDVFWQRARGEEWQAHGRRLSAG